MNSAAIAQAPIRQDHVGAISVASMNVRDVACQPKDAAFVNTLSIIAHDLRGPLASLSILVELMEAYTPKLFTDRTRRVVRLMQKLP